MEYKITFCGPSKDYFNQAHHTIVSEIALNSSELKKQLLTVIKSNIEQDEAHALIHACVIATEKHILQENTLLNESQSLFLLPPVCGG